MVNKDIQNCEIPREHVSYLSASAVVIHYEEALYQVYALDIARLPKANKWNVRYNALIDLTISI